VWNRQSQALSLYQKGKMSVNLQSCKNPGRFTDIFYSLKRKSDCLVVPTSFIGSNGSGVFLLDFPFAWSRPRQPAETRGGKTKGPSKMYHTFPFSKYMRLNKSGYFFWRSTRFDRSMKRTQPDSGQGLPCCFALVTRPPLPALLFPKQPKPAALHWDLFLMG
jgi:hypothetical protein